MADIFDLARSINAQKQRASQGYSSGWEDLPMQVMEIMDTRAKEKGVRDASSMLAIAGDYQNTFDNNELDSRISKLDLRYGGDNYKGLSAEAMSHYDNTKELLLQQRRENADFDGQYNYLNNIQSDMDTWLEDIPEDGNITSEKTEEFKSLMKGFAESRGELERKHGGRLNTTNYNTFRSNMDAITNIGMITSNQFMKDGNMSSREAEAYSNSLMTYDSTPINDYNAERKAGATQERTDLRTGIKTDISTYNTMLDNYQRGGTYNKENELVKFSAEALEEYGGDIEALQMRMENKDKKYVELGGESDYLETQGFEFASFGEPSRTETEEEKRLRLAEEERLRLLEEESKKDGKDEVIKNTMKGSELFPAGYFSGSGKKVSKQMGMEYPIKISFEEAKLSEGEHIKNKAESVKGSTISRDGNEFIITDTKIKNGKIKLKLVPKGMFGKALGESEMWASPKYGEYKLEDFNVESLNKSREKMPSSFKRKGISYHYDPIENTYIISSNEVDKRK